MSESVKNLPISILRRLRNKAQAEGRNAQDLLRYSTAKRLLDIGRLDKAGSNLFTPLLPA